MKLLPLQIILGLVLLSSSLHAQKAPTAYLLFDTADSTRYVETGGEKGRERAFVKIPQKDQSIDFYINGELFMFKPGKHSIDTLSSVEIKKVKISTLDQLQKIVEEKGAELYPSNAFHKVYLIEPINKNKAIKYEVHWQYYIE